VVTTTNAELNCYCERIEKHLPDWSSRFLRWLRQPSNRGVRIVVATLLGLGGLLSFLPVLGSWMLPLGLIIISQDLPFLQRPLVNAFQWIEARGRALKTLATRSLQGVICIGETKRLHSRHQRLSEAKEALSLATLRSGSQ
jgi:hypothetical protein